jgi:hypothetical protein
MHRRKFLTASSIRVLATSSGLRSLGAAQTPGPHSLEVWHGETQRVGHLGDAQDDFNLMGHVEPWRDLDSLTYQIPKNAAVPMFFRAYRRLVNDGDFNADIPLGRLQTGPNQVTITARFRDGHTLSKTVTVIKGTGHCRLPVSIRWQQMKHPQDAGQIVDGRWDVTKQGLRTLQTGYDRVFLIGERDWQDYEVLTSITVHRVPSETSPLSGGNGVGVILRFAGHVTGGPRYFPSGQPKWGYQPFGAIAFLRWDKGKPAESPHTQFYPGDSDRYANKGRFALRLEESYAIRFGCETLPDDAEGRGVTRYSFRIWKSSDAEPEAWTWQELQSSKIALRRGGAALLAHHVDVTFGDVEAREL